MAMTNDTKQTQFFLYLQDFTFPVRPTAFEMYFVEGRNFNLDQIDAAAARSQQVRENWATFQLFAN